MEAILSCLWVYRVLGASSAEARVHRDAFQRCEIDYAWRRTGLAVKRRAGQGPQSNPYKDLCPLWIRRGAARVCTSTTVE